VCAAKTPETRCCPLSAAARPVAPQFSAADKLGAHYHRAANAGDGAANEGDGALAASAAGGDSAVGGGDGATDGR